MAREALRWEPDHEPATDLLRATGNAPEEWGDIQEGVFR
jgi:hypothetical protein